MNPKKLYIACFIITMLIFSLSLYNVISYYTKDNQILESTYTDNSNLISVYIEDEDGDYVLTDTTNFNQGTDYVFNEEKSYCVNESVLSYNEDTSKISVTASGTDNCYVYFDYYSKLTSIYLSEQIIINNAYDEEFEFSTVEEAKLAIENKTTPDFSTTATTDEGMFATEDNDGTSYYFRGTTEDNYVEFVGMLWRIIRIDGQDNVKLMLYNEDSEATSYYPISTSVLFNYTTNSANYNDAEGYYVDANSLFLTDSKTFVENWYNVNLINYSDYLVATNYCIDMEEQSYSGSTSSSRYTIYYGSYNRLIYTGIGPSLECDTTKTGVYEYEYSVGLVSADEVVFAGGVYGSTNSDYYLNTGYDYWSLSSSYFYNRDLSGSVFTVDYSGNLSYERVLDVYYSVFPTISLSSEIIFSEGTGTITDPYIVG